MKIFVCTRNIDLTESERIIKNLIKASKNTIAILREKEHSEHWKMRIERKMQEADFVLFLLGENTFKSEALKWEYAKAKQLNKRIIGIKLENVSNESILFCQGFHVFDTATQCLPYLEKTFENDRKMLIEQYKIMVGSTEKVTDQRLRVNNLFFTITSSILSLSVIIGKAFNFSVIGAVGMLALCSMALLISFLWEKLIKSYGKLNTGKFKIIDEIEKWLRTNMFEYEWKILKEDLKYEPNTNTEAKVVRQFRCFIIFVLIIELIYFFCTFVKPCLKWLD